MRNLLGVFAVLLVCCGPAAAGTFPGGNGLIAFSRTPTPSSGPVLVAFDPASGSEHQIGTGTAPAWSPDGTRIAYVRDGNVLVANADGSGELGLGPGDTPSWSPDGTRLVVARTDGTLYVVDAGGGGASQLTQATDAHVPAWSPNGDLIAYTTSAGAVFTVSPADGSTHAVPLPVKVDGGVSWSPSGGQFSFVSTLGQIWTANADGSGARQLTYTLVGPNGAVPRPAWSPDGTSIAWIQNADLCLVDLAGNVRRLTQTQQTVSQPSASLPDWQRTGAATGPITAEPPAANSLTSCDWGAGARIDLYPTNASPRDVALKAPLPLAFVNRTGGPLTVTTTMPGGSGTVDSGGFVDFATKPGDYEFAVTGYPDGVPRRGTFTVEAAGNVTITQHAAIRYGTSTVLSGNATGSTGTVSVLAQPGGKGPLVRVATVTPSRGHWQLHVAPKLTTSYEARYAGATADRLLRVKADLHVQTGRRIATVRLRPIPRLARRQVLLFRLTANHLWAGVRSALTGRDGVAVFRNLPGGRYYASYQGDDLYFTAASEPFNVRS